MNVGFLSIARVAELLGAPVLAGAGRKPLTKAVRIEAVRATLAEAPGAFAEVVRHPTTVAALDRTFAELRLTSGPALDALAARSTRAADVVRVFRATCARLAEAYFDEHDLAAAAADVAAAGRRRRGHRRAHRLPARARCRPRCSRWSMRSVRR